MLRADGFDPAPPVIRVTVEKAVESAWTPVDGCGENPPCLLSAWIASWTPGGSCGWRATGIHSHPQQMGTLSLLCHNIIHSPPGARALARHMLGLNSRGACSVYHFLRALIPIIHRPYYYGLLFLLPIHEIKKKRGEGYSAMRISTSDQRLCFIALESVAFPCATAARCVMEAWLPRLCRPKRHRAPYKARRPGSGRLVFVGEGRRL
jgi:hypothetical protein